MEIKIPQFVTDYNKYMGGYDTNDHIAKLNKTRRHYRWPHRLFVKFFMWACCNAYVLMGYYSPHSVGNTRFRTFNCFIDQLSLQLIGSYRSSVHRRESQEKELPQRMQNVALHYPERSLEATGSIVFGLCLQVQQGCGKSSWYCNQTPTCQKSENNILVWLLSLLLLHVNNLHSLDRLASKEGILAISKGSSFIIH